MKAIILILGILTLGGCASDIPRPIQDAPERNISYAQALKEPDQQRGAPVRWGGVIAKIENRSEESWIEIVDQPLGEDGYPRSTDRSAGRFLARVSGFVDPVVYAAQRRITGREIGWHTSTTHWRTSLHLPGGKSRASASVAGAA